MSIKFHLPGFSSHYHFNRVFISMLEHCPEFFYDGLEIASVYGSFPQSLWNGGRTVPGICDKSFVKKVVSEFDKMNIPMRFTFTNPMLTEKHLEDDFCNFVLKTAENGKNGVIVVSPLLEQYIRDKYPGYKITSSTCKRITDINALNNELDKNYDIVVMDYDFNNKFDILEQVHNKEKCEILVNACCTPGCKHRVEHYRELGITQIALCEHIKKYPNKPFKPKELRKHEKHMNCPSMGLNAVDVRGLSTHISPDDIFNKYMPMGFNQFKIEGRTAQMFNLVDFYIYYMIKPEYKDLARIAFLNNLVNNDVIKTSF